MNKARELDIWDLDTKYVPNGYDMEQVPTATDENFAYLLERHNELVRQFNELLDDLHN